MLPKIMQAIELGLGVLDSAFDRINVNEISDSEDEEDISSEGRTILEPKVCAYLINIFVNFFVHCHILLYITIFL